MNSFIPVSVLSFVLFSAATKAAADPYSWDMSCARWEERSYEILQDESLGTDTNRHWLITHLRTKVSEDCRTPEELVN